MEELVRSDFKIMGLIMPHIDIPSFNTGDIDNLLTYRKDDILKMVLLNENDLEGKLSSNVISKLQFAVNMDNDIVALYDFSKGLNLKELTYFKQLFKRMTNRYDKKIILVSRDMNFLSDICDTFAVYDKKVLYKTTDVFDDVLYHYVDMPNIVKFIKAANRKGAKLKRTLEINELLKDVYRSINENKNDSEL